jgi:hypothetical protein
MAIKDNPHYELAAVELARWLDQQGGDRWWTVDGDAALGSRLFVPCPGDELAAALRKVNKLLLLADKDAKPETRGQLARAEDLDRLADRFEHYGKNGMVTDRGFYLCWKGSDDDWMIVEDMVTTERYAEEAHRQQEAR